MEVIHVEVVLDNILLALTRNHNVLHYKLEPPHSIATLDFLHCKLEPPHRIANLDFYDRVAAVNPDI